MVCILDRAGFALPKNLLFPSFFGARETGPPPRETRCVGPESLRISGGTHLRTYLTAVGIIINNLPQLVFKLTNAFSIPYFT